MVPLPPGPTRQAWALAKVMWFGRVQYSEPITVRVGPMRDAIALVDGRPLAVALLGGAADVVLRRSAGAGLLPADRSSAQFRQLRRWIAQVLIIETICQQTGSLAADGADGGHPELDAAMPPRISGRSWRPPTRPTPGVRASLPSVSARPSRPDADPDPPVAIADPGRDSSTCGRRFAAVRWTRCRRCGRWAGSAPADVPGVPSGEALARTRSSDASIGPVGSSLGEHLFVVDEVRDRPSSDATHAHANEADRRRLFLDWLARQRRDRVVEVTGYEHPADPRQPDHQHRH